MSPSPFSIKLRCFRWKCCADKTKPKRLVVRDCNYNVTTSWYYSYRPVDDDDVIERIQFFGQFTKVIRLNIEHVTCLIVDTRLLYVDAKVLNRFQQLKHLEFALVICQQVKTPKIILPHLKRLKIGCAAYHHLGTAIDAPELEILSCMKGLSGIKIPHSKSVKHLQIGDKQQNLKNFENVEVFSCFTPESIVADIFEQLPKLKKIHFVDGHYKDTCAKFLNFKETETAMNRLIEQKKSLGKNDLELRFLGEPLDDSSKMFKDYGFHDTFQRIFID